MCTRRDCTSSGSSNEFFCKIAWHTNRDGLIGNVDYWDWKREIANENVRIVYRINILLINVKRRSNIEKKNQRHKN